MCLFRPIVSAFALAAIAATPIRADAQSRPVDPAAERVVSVFSGGLGQIWEFRPMALASGPGSQTLVLDHISRQAIAESIRIAGFKGDVDVRELSLRRATLTPKELLERYLGHDVGVIKVHPTTGEERIVKATVVSLAAGVVLRVNGRLETGMPGRLSFPDDTFGLTPRPVLSATLKAGPGVNGLGLTYLTGGLNWAVDYTAQLSPEGDRLNLAGWAGVQNNTGVMLAANQLRLVAGKINRSTPPPSPRFKVARTMAAESVAQDASGLPGRQAVGAAHVYTLTGPVTLENGERKQVALLRAADVPVTEILVSTGHPVVFGTQRGEPRPNHPQVRLSFDNKSLVAGGLPLPAGVVRVYREAPGGPPLFSGEDRIADTPDGETAKLTLGQAFDVTVRREQTGFKRLDAKGRNVEAAFKIEIRNGRDKPAQVRVDENLPGDWTVMESSAGHMRVGSQAQWLVTIPAKGKAFVTYKVRVLR